MVDERKLKEGDYVERRLRPVSNLFGVRLRHVRLRQQYKSILFVIVREGGSLYAKKLVRLNRDGTLEDGGSSLEPLIGRKNRGVFIIDQLRAMVKYCL